MPFHLKTLLDTVSDLNLLNKEIILVNFWQKTQASAVGLGNIPTEISFQIPEATLCFKQYCLHLKFLLADIPTACILGTPFLAAIEPHGSTMLANNRPGYFISIPSVSKDKKVTINLPFVSVPRISNMVQTIKNKILKIEELKGQQSGIRIREQLSQNQIQQKILLLKQ